MSFAPVLIIPDVLSPQLCRTLISVHEAGSRASGFMKDCGSAGCAEEMDPKWKIRRDANVTDRELLSSLNEVISNRIVPLMQMSFHYQVTRIERFLVACYDSTEGGHFGPHRDHESKITAHRRFACTINLNDDYHGGELAFHEFKAMYKLPPGAAIVFSGWLLHQVLPVTKGKRFAFLTFLHDESAQAIFDRNSLSVESKRLDATACGA